MKNKIIIIIIIIVCTLLLSFLGKYMTTTENGQEKLRLQAIPSDNVTLTLPDIREAGVYDCSCEPRKQGEIAAAAEAASQ